MGTFRSPLVARPAPTRQRSTNERPALHRKQTSTTHEGLLRYHRGALGVECRGAGFGSWRGCRVVRRGSAVSRTAAGAPGVWNQSPKEFGEGLWNQAVGKGVEDYGAWLHKSAGGRKLLLGENIEALGKNLEQFGQVQSGIGFVKGDKKLWDQGVSDQVKGSFLNGWGNWLRSWSG